MSCKDNFLLIGNSAEVLDHNLGEQIDAFSGILIRFNNWESKGFESKIGSRCDWLARRSCDDVKLFDSKDLERVLAFVTYCRFTSGMSAVAVQLKQHYEKRCCVLSPAKCFGYAKSIGYENDLNRWPSCGVLCLAHLLETYHESKIVLHGFGGKLECKYFSKGKDSHYHNEHLERHFISDLVKSGRIQILKDA